MVVVEEFGFVEDLFEMEDIRFSAGFLKGETGFGVAVGAWSADDADIWCWHGVGYFRANCDQEIRSGA